MIRKDTKKGRNLYRGKSYCETHFILEVNVIRQLQTLEPRVFFLLTLWKEEICDLCVIHEKKLVQVKQNPAHTGLKKGPWRKPRFARAVGCCCTTLKVLGLKTDILKKSYDRKVNRKDLPHLFQVDMRLDLSVPVAIEFDQSSFSWTLQEGMLTTGMHCWPAFLHRDSLSFIGDKVVTRLKGQNSDDIQRIP